MKPGDIIRLSRNRAGMSEALFWFCPRPSDASASFRQVEHGEIVTIIGMMSRNLADASYVVVMDSQCIVGEVFLELCEDIFSEQEV